MRSKDPLMRKDPSIETANLYNDGEARAVKVVSKSESLIHRLKPERQGASKAIRMSMITRPKVNAIVLKRWRASALDT